MIDCFLITICCVIVIDQLRFVDEITSIVSGWMTGGHIRKPMDIKPLSCSTCMSFWLSLAYIICVGKFSVAFVTYILALSWSAPLINDIFTLVKQTIIKILNKLM